VNSPQYAAEADDEGCSGRESLDLGKGLHADLPGALTAPLFEDLELASVVLGVDLPADLVEKVRTRVGLPFVIEASVRADGEELRAIKRLLLSERETTHQNPPAPSFRFDDTTIVTRDAASFTCATREGRPAFAKAGAEIALVPIVEDDADEEPWLEDFEVIDSRGEIVERKERAFYSWFATAGDFSEDVTKSPLRDNRWRAPEDAGCHSMWLVVRDGHGGESACELEVAVGERDACDAAPAR
jgi:hypothetical protein